MYLTLLFLHSLVRWLVLLGLLYALTRAFRGYYLNSPFSKTDNAVRHWTATIAHIQLTIGAFLFFKSPVVKAFRNSPLASDSPTDLSFFGLIHVLLMLGAIVILTIGSAKAKRKTMDSDKFKTMLIWFSLALFIILLAIPWPFSPLASRPFFRSI